MKAVVRAARSDVAELMLVDSESSEPYLVNAYVADDVVEAAIQLSPLHFHTVSKKFWMAASTTQNIGGVIIGHRHNWRRFAGQ